MALKTFQNLSSDRQEEILMASFEEFALKGYQSASLSEIIKKLGLAKGSFYRYFTNKKELYSYLIEESSKRRLSNLEVLLNDPDIDFFVLLKQNFLEKVRFDIENPLIGGFLYKIMHEKDTSEVSGLIKNLYGRLIEQTKQILMLEKFKKQLTVTDPELVAFQIFNTQLWLYDYVAYKFGIDYEQNIRNRKPVLDLPLKELEQIIEMSVDMLRNGIKASE
ncbi:MAG: TetR/AcrR family transcriptional regulator [Salinivirgaceae bacterium]